MSSINLLIIKIKCFKEIIKNEKKSLLLLTSIFLIATVFVGCGKSDGTSGASKSNDTQVEESSTSN